MKNNSPTPAKPTPIGKSWRDIPVSLIATIIGLLICFAVPLTHLWTLAMNSDLYSHTILIPVVCIYLAWENGKRIETSSPNRLLALIPAAIGLISLYAFYTVDANPTNPDQVENYLGYSIFALVMFAVAANFFFLGRHAARINLFPILFLVWMTPFTVPIREGLQIFFQYASAENAYWFIKLSGVPIFRNGALIFEMPTIVMEVAPECSGIRSSLVLFITSLVASYLFLKTPWKRSALVFLVIPLGILRNGIRILVLALQCFHIHPDMINGWFHKHGGQPLFAVTLIPLFAVLYFFWKSENKKKKTN